MEPNAISQTKLIDKTDLQICRECGLTDGSGILFTNTFSKKETKSISKATMEILAKHLASTLGPYGQNTIVQNTMANRHFCTKDGLDVITRMKFDNELSESILEMIQQVASNQVMTVGDGSTSAVVIANSLFQVITNNEDDLLKKLSPKDISDILGGISDNVEKLIKTKYAKQISPDLSEIGKLAAVSTNNDAKIGSLIKEAYDHIGRYGFITDDTTQAITEDRIEYKQGIEWERGYIDECFARDVKNGKVTSERPYIVLIKGTVDWEVLSKFLQYVIGSYCMRDKRQLVIVAIDYTEEAKQGLINMRMNDVLTHQSVDNELMFTAVDIDSVTAVSRSKMESMAVSSGCICFEPAKDLKGIDIGEITDDVVVKKVFGRFVGESDGATITKKTTQIRCSDVLPDPEKEKKKQELIATVKEEADKLMNLSEPTDMDKKHIFELRSQIADLTISGAVYHVGGKSSAERTTRERLIEDAIYSTKSALKYGYVIGGNLIVPLVLTEHGKDISEDINHDMPYIGIKQIDHLVQLVIKAFLESYQLVIENAGLDGEAIASDCLRKKRFFNLKVHKFEKFEDTSVINSADTDIQIMRTCMSIIGILATSNQAITLHYNMIGAAK